MQAGPHITRRRHPLRNRVVALAAMVQCAHLVQGIARKGKADSGEIETCISSLFASAGSTPEHLYGGLPKVRTGLFLLSRLLRGNEVGKARELIAYTAAMITLEHKLSRKPAQLQKLASGIQRIEKQSEYFRDIMHDNIIAAIAGLYGETISTMKPRIIVRGKADYLHHSHNTNMVRALLMSGIHGAHLWRTSGGGHLQLLLRRRAMAKEALAILREVG